jgi:GntR family transcriptional regulator
VKNNLVKKKVSTLLYYQLAESLREQIASGRLKSGEQLSSERDLSENHGISRMTVRQALSHLEPVLHWSWIKEGNN